MAAHKWCLDASNDVPKEKSEEDNPHFLALTTHLETLHQSTSSDSNNNSNDSESGDTVGDRKTSWRSQNIYNLTELKRNDQKYYWYSNYCHHFRQWYPRKECMYLEDFNKSLAANMNESEENFDDFKIYPAVTMSNNAFKTTEE